MPIASPGQRLLPGPDWAGWEVANAKVSNGETGDAKRGDRGRKTGRPGTLFLCKSLRDNTRPSARPPPRQGGGWGDGAGLALKLTGPSPSPRLNNKTARNVTVSLRWQIVRAIPRGPARLAYPGSVARSRIQGATLYYIEVLPHVSRCETTPQSLQHRCYP